MRGSAVPSPVVSMPLLLYALAFCAALFCAFARPLAANPTQCMATPAIPQHVLASHSQTSQVIANAFLRSAAASRCRSFPLQFLALPSLSIAEHSLAAAERICSAAYRSFALANLSAVARSLSIANPGTSEPFHCASRLCTARHCSSHLRHSVARLLDTHRCNSSAIRVTAMPMPRFSLLSQYTAPQSSPLLFRCQS